MENASQEINQLVHFVSCCRSSTFFPLVGFTLTIQKKKKKKKKISSRFCRTSAASYLPKPHFSAMCVFQFAPHTSPTYAGIEVASIYIVNVTSLAGKMPESGIGLNVKRKDKFSLCTWIGRCTSTPYELL